MCGRTCPAGLRDSVAALPVAALLVVLPWMNGGRSPLGQLWLSVLASVALLAALLTCRLRPTARTLLVSVALVAVSWCSLLWSRCPEETVGAALVVSACAAIFLVLSGPAGRPGVVIWLAVGLSVGVLSSAAVVAFQQIAAPVAPDAWLDPVFRGVIRNRISGPTDNPNILAGYLAYALPVSLGMAVSLPGSVGWLCAAASGAAGGCLLLTFSRAGWLGGLGGLLVVLVVFARSGHRPYWGRLLPLAVVLAVALATYPREIGLRSTHVPRIEDGTLEHRLFMWRAGLTMLRWDPLTGVGLGCYQACFPGACPRGVMKKYALVRSPGSAHSDYVQVLSEYGLGGGVLLAALGAMAVAWAGVQHPRTSCPSETLLRSGSWGTLVAASLGGIAQSNLQTPLCGILLVVAAALLYAQGNADDAHLPPGRAVRVAFSGFIVVVLLLPGLALSRHIAHNLCIQAREDAYARRTASALQVAALAGRLAPLYADVPCLIGDIHAVVASDDPNARHLEQAERAYRRGLTLDPCSGVLWCKLSDILERRRQLAAAFNCARNACKLDWYKASYHLLAARLARELGRTEDEKSLLKTSITLFPLEISLVQERNEGGGWYATVLARAHSDAIKRYEEAFRRAPAPRPLLEGASSLHERRLIAQLRRCGIRGPIRHVGVVETGTGLVASIETGACGDGTKALPASLLEADSLRALRAAFGLDRRVQHVDFTVFLPHTEESVERVILSVAASRQRYRKAHEAEPTDRAALLARLEPVRYTDRSPRDVWDDIKAMYRAPSGDSPGQAKVRALTQARKDPGGRVALTIDDGPYPLVTPMLLASLRRHGALATFFLVGKDAEDHPGLVMEILRGGHELACHTYSHRRLNDLEPAETYAEIRAGCDVIEALSGSVPAFFRAPGGCPTLSGLAIAEEMGLCTAFWSQNLADWFAATPGGTDATHRKFSSGDIILAHGSSRANVRRLELLLEDLHAQGLNATRLGNLYPPESIEAMSADRVLDQVAYLR